MMSQFDAIIIGAGQAGPPLAVRLAKSGKKVALIERKNFGGTCVNTGCIPSKTLIASAEVAHTVQQCQEFGLSINGNIIVDMKKIKQRKDAIVNKSSQGVEKWLKSTPHLQVYEGHAHFSSSRIIKVNDIELTAEKIFINAGARPFIPPMPGLDKINYFTSSSIMEVDFIPEHLIIIGGSYIGLEFAQMFRRFGSKVSIIEKESRLISREDEDVSETVLSIMKKSDIDVYLNSNCIAFDQSGENIIVQLDCEQKTKQVTGSHVLLAIGRTPNTQDLGLENAGVKTDNRGYIQVDDQLQTNVSGLWALGECNGRGAFTHTAYNDYEIVADNLLENRQRRVTDRIPAYALYIDPPLGRAGYSEEQARKSGRKIFIAKYPMTRVKRAIIKGKTEGFIKILIDADSKEILGSAILGVGGDEIIHSILDIMYAKKPYTVIKEAVHIHPTVSELIPTTLADLQPLKLQE